MNKHIQAIIENTALAHHCFIAGAKFRDGLDGWVSCEERTPEQDTDVLAAGNEGPKDAPDWYYHVAQYNNGRWTTESEELYFITHWQALPKPPIE